MSTCQPGDHLLPYIFSYLAFTLVCPLGMNFCGKTRLLLLPLNHSWWYNCHKQDDKYLDNIQKF
jgi:hypothetical protein